MPTECSIVVEILYRKNKYYSAHKSLHEAFSPGQHTSKNKTKLNQISQGNTLYRLLSVWKNEEKNLY